MYSFNLIMDSSIVFFFLSNDFDNLINAYKTLWLFIKECLIIFLVNKNKNKKRWGLGLKL
jgi:hypothetical protein